MQLLAEPIEAAPQSLQDRISYLESIIVQLKEENAAMAATQAHLIENQEIQLRLIHELKEKAKRSPGKTDVHKIPPIKIFSGAEEQVMNLPISPTEHDTERKRLRQAPAIH